MVVDDANKNPCLEGFGDTCAIGGTAVDRKNQLNAVFKGGGDRPLGDAMTIAVALRDVPLGNRANCAERSNHDCSTSESVRIKIADHEDRLPHFASGAQARNQPSCVGEEVRVVQGTVVAIKELARMDWVGKTTTVEECRERKVQVLGDQQIAEELQELWTYL